MATRLAPSDVSWWLMPLPEDSAARKRIPLASGVLDYFGSALVGVAFAGELYTNDHADAIVVHLLQRGKGNHSALMCKHALELLQLEITGAQSCAPVRSGRIGDLFDVYDEAMIAIAEMSVAGNAKHIPGQPLCHVRGISMDHSDCIMRHRRQRGTMDRQGKRHSASLAWRCLALYQEELEDQGAPMARNVRVLEAAQ